jgi:hypothetical protein
MSISGVVRSAFYAEGLAFLNFILYTWLLKTLNRLGHQDQTGLQRRGFSIMFCRSLSRQILLDLIHLSSFAAFFEDEAIARLFPISHAPVFLMFCKVYHSPKFNYPCLPLSGGDPIQGIALLIHQRKRLTERFIRSPPVNNTDKANRSIRQPKISKASHQGI